MSKNRLIGSTILVVALLVLTVSGISMAAGSTNLEIIHEPVVEAPSNSPLTIETEVDSTNRIQRVILFMRSAGTDSYYKIVAKAKADGSYQAVIPANFMSEGTLEYYLQAEDDQGNLTTFPGANAAGEPQQISVVPDTTVPTARLVTPKGMIGEESFGVTIRLDDPAANINAESAEVLLNGVDITQRINVSSRFIRFKVQANEISSSNKILIKVADLAGNQMEETFKVTQHPLISGNLDLALTTDEDGSIFSTELQVDASWNAFSASMNLTSDDLAGSSFEGTYNISYDSKYLDVGLIDTNTSTSELTASGYGHRGIDLDLSLGPVKTVVGYGYAQPAINGEQYARRFLGMRQALDFGLVRLGLNFDEIIDETETIAIADVNPKQNYVLSLDGGVTFKDFNVNAEIASSVYFDNARGNLWDNLDEIPDEFSGYDLATYKETLQDAPDLAKKLFPLPFNPGNQIDSLTQYLEGVDLGAKVSFETPLPWSEVSGSYYYYGPRFMTLAGNGGKDAQGYEVSFETDRFLDLFDFELAYEKYRDNLPTILNLASSDEGDGETANYMDYTGEVGLYTDPFDSSLEYNHQEEQDYSTARLKNDQDTITLKLKNIDFVIADWESTLNTSFSTSEYNEYDAAGITEIDGKRTDKGSVKANLRKAPWKYSLGYGTKIETDNDGTSATSPTITVGGSWEKRELLIGKIELYKLKVASDLSQTQVKGDNEEESTINAGLKVTVSLSRDSKWILSYDYSQTEDKLDSSNDSTSTNGGLAYSYSF